MDFTGERPSLEHEVEGSRLRYKSIIPYVRNKNVFDYGCGIGLGSYMLSHFALNVTGFDVSPEAIEEAAKNFKSPDLSFITMLTPESLRDIDILVMVEVLEHMEKDNLHTLLRLISSNVPEIACTTPDGITMPYQPMTLSERRGYHVWHYNIQELKSIFSQYYSFVEVYGHLYDPRIGRYTSYVIYASNNTKWDDNWIKDPKFIPKE